MTRVKRASAHADFHNFCKATEAVVAQLSRVVIPLTRLLLVEVVGVKRLQALLPLVDHLRHGVQTLNLGEVEYGTWVWLVHVNELLGCVVVTSDHVEERVLVDAVHRTWLIVLLELLGQA